tara:strand:+ start:75 stop:557 length:483 start_codon:yes stop_codon:yes gene_type:complete
MLLDKIEFGLVGVRLQILKGEEDLGTQTEYLAITNMKNQAIDKDNIKSTDIANTYKRCFAKAVSIMTGYGFALYTDELVDGLSDKQDNNKTPKKETKMISEEQVKLIHKLKDDLKLTEERYRELLKMGKSTDGTSKGLSHIGATRLIEFMKKEQNTKENF